MKDIRDICAKRPERKRKLLQFGEGNFLRGFVDEMIDVANEKGFMDTEVIIVKPREGKPAEAFDRQDCLYTTSLRGSDEIRIRLVSCVKEICSCYEDYERYMSYADDEKLRFIVSNTTEAGIVYDSTDSMDSKPAGTFPGKLTQFLYRRYKTFSGSKEMGVIVLPVELIDDNGGVLKDCVKKLSENWKLEQGFSEWIDEACIFCSTLVDRIISGYPTNEAEKLWKEWGYKDELIVTGEPFGLWVIQSDRDISSEFALKQAGLPVVFTDDIKPYKKRKVRILNGAHTSFVPAAYLMGYDTVGEAIEDSVIERYVTGFFDDEAIPTLELDKRELESFADLVLKRFRNPYIKHRLSDIALNSVSKWKTRCLPTMLDLISEGKDTKHLTFSLAALLAFYRGKYDEKGHYTASRMYKGKAAIYEIRDERAVLDTFADAAEYDIPDYVKTILSNENLWGMSLDGIDGLACRVTDYLTSIIADPGRAMESIEE